MQVEIRETRLFFRESPNLKYKVLAYEEAEDGHRIYYQSRSFEGRDAAEAYKKELEKQYGIAH